MNITDTTPESSFAKVLELLAPLNITQDVTDLAKAIAKQQESIATYRRVRGEMADRVLQASPLKYLKDDGQPFTLEDYLRGADYQMQEDQWEEWDGRIRRLMLDSEVGHIEREVEEGYDALDPLTERLKEMRQAMVNLLGDICSPELLCVDIVCAWVNQRTASTPAL
jgi:hypothetical protein